MTTRKTVNRRNGREYVSSNRVVALEDVKGVFADHFVSSLALLSMTINDPDLILDVISNTILKFTEEVTGSDTKAQFTIVGVLAKKMLYDLVQKNPVAMDELKREVGVDKAQGTTVKDVIDTIREQMAAATREHKDNEDDASSVS